MTTYENYIKVDANYYCNLFLFFLWTIPGLGSGSEVFEDVRSVHAPCRSRLDLARLLGYPSPLVILAVG